MGGKRAGTEFQFISFVLEKGITSRFTLISAGKSKNAAAEKTVIVNYSSP